MKRRLGRTGYEVLPLGLGGHTYPIGNEPNAFVTPDQRASLVKTLVEGGVNYFDTTFFNEVQSIADSFRRAGIGNKAVVSLQYVDALSDEKWPLKLRPEVENRLSVMGYSSAPLFLMGVGNGTPSYQDLVRGCDALAKLKDEGLIQHIGLSCHQFGYFSHLARLVEETDLPDYLLIRFNWKYPQASDELFPTAKAHNVGVVAMKVFCWDCGPNEWGRRISVFEPVSEDTRDPGPQRLTPAQRSLIWTLQHEPVAVAVPAINAPWEAEQNLRALGSLDEEVDTSDFSPYGDRLWSESELKRISEQAESKAIRDRARLLCARQ